MQEWLHQRTVDEHSRPVIPSGASVSERSRGICSGDAPIPSASSG